MESLYSPHNMTMVIAGGVDVQKVQELVSQYMGNMNRFDIFEYSKVIDEQTKPTVLVKQKNTEQVHIAVGVRTTPLEHTDRYALDVLAAVLGGGMSSRLFHEVREKRGLAYYVRTSSDNYTDCGTLVTTAGVDPKRITDAIGVIIEEYKKIKTPGTITEEELRKAKEYIKGHFVLEMEDSREVADFYGNQELLESKIEDPDFANAHIDEVTVGKLSEVANRYIIESTLNLAIIGNVTDNNQFMSLLTLE
jgi:predicted Zn-dependent peptidase